MIEIIQATNTADFTTIESLAKEIFHEVYDAYITRDHVSYYLEEYQTTKAIQQQIKTEHYSYFLLKYQTQTVGYLGLQEQENTLVISKIYLLSSHRGLAIGKTALAFVTAFANKKGFGTIELIVNRENKRSIEAYKKSGYRIVESLVSTYSNGHSEKDYKMQKMINPQS